MIRIKIYSLTFLLGISLLFSVSLHSQDFFPPVTNYTTDDYGHNFAPDNHGITQDKSGVMYFGNTGNILTFDGTRWEKIPTVPTRITRSLYTSKNETIYVGTLGDFGYLETDSIGSYFYVSLVDSTIRNNYPFTDIWSIVETKDAIYFHSEEQIFEYNDDEVKALEMPSTAHTVFDVNDKLVARMRGLGLMQWENEQWIKIKGSEVFEHFGVFGIVPFKEKGEHLVITQELGMFKWNQAKEIEPINGQNDAFLNNLLIFGANRISDNKIALKTFDKGCIIINNKGSEVGRINIRMGLRSNEIKNQFIDHDGNLWLGLGNGLALVNLESRLSYFGENQGLIGGVETVLQTNVNRNEHLYVGTNEGLYRINQKNESLSKVYEKIEAIKSNVWSLKKSGDFLYVGTSEGLFRLDLKKEYPTPERINRQNVNALYVDNEKGFIISAGNQGLQVLNAKNLNPVFTFKEPFASVTNIERTTKENETVYWFGLQGQGVLKLTYLNKNFEVDFFTGVSLGLPDDHVIVPQKLNGQVVFGTTEGLLNVDESVIDGESYTFFMPEKIGDSTFTDALFYLTEDESNIWYCIDNDVGVMDKQNKTFINRPFWGIKKGRVNTLYRPEQNDYLWIGATEGLIRYNIKGETPHKQHFNTLIRKVWTQKEETVFGGNELESRKPIALDYEKNFIHFTYSAPYFEDHQPIEYSYKLKGYNNNWSEWTQKTEIEFTNLLEGDYVFKVKARNVYHQEAEPAEISFTILTPWYRSATAYTGYVILFLLIIIIVVKISSYRLKQQNKRLESAVKERTKEIEEKNSRLEDQKTKILHQKTEIEDSINYAQRIQRAILPLKTEMTKNLKDSFIMFWPKDVVSGDFYWFYQRGDESIIVCADCTGHGVPGAFMSMIGVDKLNVCVGEKGITSPDKILSFLNEGIKNSLRQDDGKKATRDGMDAAIITINQKEKTLKYAGAHRPLWYIQEGELHEIKATKVAVGGFTPIDQIYELRELRITEKTSVYLTSDGYADQFGGPRNKKFKVKALKNLIIDNHQKSMSDQKDVLENEMKIWAKGYEQVDDICVIGVLVE
ncbi:MAG: SpoIIE family protein phosphatase [Brumimicrobium sp.]